MDTPLPPSAAPPQAAPPPGTRSRSASLTDVLLWAALGVLVVVVGIGGLWVVRRQNDLRSVDPVAGGSAGDAGAALAGWCPDGLAPAAGDTCLALPPGAVDRREGDPPLPLVVYLHGRYDAASEAQEMARTSRVARMATAKGYAVLAPRGTLGRCGDPQLQGFTCWPSNARTAEFGREVVTSWQPALASAQETLGLGPRFLLGFSNGGYFASLVAEDGLAAFDAVVVAHAGPVDPFRAEGKKLRMLLITSDDDPSNDEMIRLDQLLGRYEWPRVTVGREGGHDLPEWDVDKALAFFARWKEPLPLSPPLAARGARAAATDAGLPAPPDPLPGRPDAAPAAGEEELAARPDDPSQETAGSE